MHSVGMQSPMAESLDVVISVGFVRSIIMTEAKKRKDWNTKAELDSVKAVVTAIVPASGCQADGFLSSGPLESPKQIGNEMKYNAIFPLKVKNNGAPTRITMPGLIQRDRSAEGADVVGQYKRQTIELLITLVFGNEAVVLGKATLLVTGEEIKTKQTDLPIDTGKKSVLQLQKKSTFPMKRVASLSSNKEGEISPVSFKYDRRRRKYQIEKDAVLRAYMKCVPSNPYAHQNNVGASQRYNVSQSASIARSSSSIPKVIAPDMGFEPYMGGSMSSNLGLNSVTGGSYGRGRGNNAALMAEYRDHSGRTFQAQTGFRSQSSPRTGQSPSVQGTGSMHSYSQGRAPIPLRIGTPAPFQVRAPAPFQGMVRQRSSSTPRQKSSALGGHGSAYGGSSYNGSRPDYSFSGSGTRGRSVSRSSSSNHQHYGGSSYGSPVRKAAMASQSSQYGGSHFKRPGGSQQMRSPSPHVYIR
jgi:hypothetical protein